MKRLLFTFDLNQAQLAKYYPGNSPTYAYSQIGAFLLKNGFEHNQGSGYVSKEPMKVKVATDVALKLQEKFPWLNKCSSVFELTQVNEKKFDIKKVFASVEEKQYNQTEKLNKKINKQKNKKG